MPQGTGGEFDFLNAGGWVGIHADRHCAAQRRSDLGCQSHTNAESAGDGVCAGGDFIHRSFVLFFTAPKLHLHTLATLQAGNLVFRDRKQHIPWAVLCQPQHRHARTHHLPGFGIDACDNTRFVGHQLAVGHLVGLCRQLRLRLVDLGLCSFEGGFASL